MFDPEQLPVPDLGLRCLRCGHPLGGLTEHVCPDCGRAFRLEEHVPRGDYPPLIADGRQVRAETEVIRLLRLYQIPYLEIEELLPDVFGGTSLFTRRQPARIGVPREMYLQAVDLLRRFALGERLPDPPANAMRTEPWCCAHCEEDNPPNFDVCWNCGEPDGVSDDSGG